MSFIKIASICFALLCLSANTQAAPQIPPAASVKACSAIVYDLDNEVILFEQNGDEKIPPASLTKVLSMFLGMDHVAEGRSALQDPVTISPLAASVTGSRMGLRPGEEVTLGKLLMGMAVSSGNDASHALAEHVGGSAEAFVRMMNARCQALGMEDSNFANPHGLPAPGQYTTARDMLTLARAYLRAHPSALDFHNTRVLQHGASKTWNRNPLLGQYQGADGLKTGWVRASGYNMIFTATRNNRRLLAVIMGAPDSWARGVEACRLLDAGFEVCENRAVSVAAALDQIPFDLNRIDPRKTAREHGILKPRLTATKALKAAGAKRLLAAKGKKAQLAKARGKNIKYTAAVEKRRIKGSNVTQHKAATMAAKAKNSSSGATRAKASPKGKSHAERRQPRARRG